MGYLVVQDKDLLTYHDLPEIKPSNKSDRLHILYDDSAVSKDERNDENFIVPSIIDLRPVFGKKIEGET